jgi:UDP-N-acetylglucosamine 4-epimerase
MTNESNLSGYLNMLVAARDANVKRFIYASSSSVYGDSQVLPKIEHIIGKPLSPYTITKLVNELYADIFFQTYGLETIGLRYFNVFGRRQNSIGAYSAVIPTWISGMLNNETIYINGDGESSRDFCYIDNVIQANLLAAISSNPLAVNQVYNIAVGEQTTLNQLYYYLRDCLSIKFLYLNEAHPVYREFRPGDIRHSLADIQKAREIIGYEPLYRASDGLNHSIQWYVDSYLSAGSLKK